MWNLITRFLTFTGGMSAGVVLMHFAGRKADGHDRGCVLFYKVDQNSDFETMERVVRCFSELGVKATQASVYRDYAFNKIK